METIECIKTRRSVRKYTDQPIEREILQKIMDATVYAPSWKNTQIVRYTFVADREKINSIATEAVLGFAFNTKTMQRSAMLAVQSVVTGISGYEPDGSFSTDKGNGWEMYDAGISVQTFCLAAHEYGIGTVIMGVVDDLKIRSILGIPDTETVTAVIGMGYPLENHSAPQRKDVSELVRFIG
ncbi:MAG: nitroreductase family protein [Synergistaceae bacterium]|nr:nitroreductase family protein [Synergistaceae bacterium]